MNYNNASAFRKARQLGAVQGNRNPTAQIFYENLLAILASTSPPLAFLAAAAFFRFTVIAGMPLWCKLCALFFLRKWRSAFILFCRNEKYTAIVQDGEKNEKEINCKSFTHFYVICVFVCTRKICRRNFIRI